MNFEVPFDPTLKKKKKVPIEKPILEEATIEKPAADENFTLSTDGKIIKRKKVLKKTVVSKAKASADSDAVEKDELYSTLLDRLRATLEKDHPNFDTKIVFPSATIGRDGKKTIWSNFGETATVLGRSVDHFSRYVFAELSANGSINEKNQLVFKAGKYTTTTLENVTKKYYLNYVRCKSCNSSKTHFTKQDRMEFIVCDACGSRRCVDTINRGYETVFKRKK